MLGSSCWGLGLLARSQSGVGLGDPGGPSLSRGQHGPAWGTSQGMS